MNVWLIAATHLNSNYDEFLKGRNVHWRIEPGSTATERLVEFAGRICYMSFGAKQSPRSTGQYIKNLIDQKHESVLEHASFTLLIDGVSRALSHQLVRHRVGFSYSQLSQQYFDENDANFVLPVVLEKKPEAAATWVAATTAARDAYRAMMNLLNADEAAEPFSGKEALRARRSAARSLLPNATATTLVITGNARSWRDFLETRGSTIGDHEMRGYCQAVVACLREASPLLFADFVSEIGEDELPLVIRRRVND